MNTMDWGPETQEDPEEVREALTRVRKEGDHKKLVRRSVAGSVTAVLAALAVGVATFSGANSTPGSNPGDIAAPPTSVETVPELSLAAKVTKTAKTALTDLKSIEATEELLYTGNAIVGGADKSDPETFVFSYKIAEDGSRYEESTRNAGSRAAGNLYEEETRSFYDASTGETLSCHGSTMQKETCNRSSDSNGAWLGQHFGRYAATIDEAAKAQDVTATEGTEASKQIWTLEYTRIGDPFVSGDAKVRVRITVDQETGLPIYVSHTINGVLVDERKMTNLTVNASYNKAELAALVRPSTSYANADDPSTTFAKGTPADAVKKVIPVPSVSGYSVMEAFTTRGGSFALNQCPSSDAVSYIGRDGIFRFDAFVLDGRNCTSSEPGKLVNFQDTDPDYSGSEVIKTVVPTQGALKGGKLEIIRMTGGTYEGELVMEGDNGKIAVSVHGDLNVDQLTELANSFTLAR